MRFFKLNFLFAALLLIGLAGCGDDETGKAGDEINVSDGDAVSETLKFKNVTAVSEDGEIPAASTDATAPKLYDDGYDDIKSISGANMVLEIDQETGNELKGMYLQIDGSSKYFDISLEASSSNGRIAAGRATERFLGDVSRVQDYITDIVITLPEELASGKFCITFAVYDSEGRVSNHINACVEVLKSAGDESSDFLTANAWEMVYEYSKEKYDSNGDGIFQEEEIYEDYDSTGVISYNQHMTTILCSDTSYQEITVTTEGKTEYVYVTFSPDGSLVLEEDSYETYVDYQNSTCENIVYLTDNENTGSTNGTWSYDGEKKELTMIMEYVDEGVIETAVINFTVEPKDGFIVIREQAGNEGYEYYSETYFKPKQ